MYVCMYVVVKVGRVGCRSFLFRPHVSDEPMHFHQLQCELPQTKVCVSNGVLGVWVVSLLIVLRCYRRVLERIEVPIQALTIFRINYIIEVLPKKIIIINTSKKVRVRVSIY